MIKKLQLLSEASDVILDESKNKTLSERLDYIVKKTTEILDAELCSLWLVKDSNVYLETSFDSMPVLGNIKNNLSSVQKREPKEIKLQIKSGKKSGLTGHIAYERKVFNAYGEKLRNHFAIKNKDATDFLPSKYPYSELACPLVDPKEKLIRLLIASNKKDETGKPILDEEFSKEFDELLMHDLVAKLIIAIENSKPMTAKFGYKIHNI